MRALSIYACATLAAGLMSVGVEGTASANPSDPGCVAINTAIQGQLTILGEVAVTNPVGFLQAAPPVLASIQALRVARPDCGGSPIPNLEQLIPRPRTAPAPSKNSRPGKPDTLDNLVSTANSTAHFAKCIFEVGMPTGLVLAFASPEVIGAVAARYGGLIGGSLIEVVNNALHNDLAKSYTNAVVHDCGEALS